MRWRTCKLPVFTLAAVTDDVVFQQSIGSEQVVVQEAHRLDSGVAVFLLVASDTAQLGGEEGKVAGTDCVQACAVGGVFPG